MRRSHDRFFVIYYGTPAPGVVHARLAAIGLTAVVRPDPDMWRPRFYMHMLKYCRSDSN